MKFETKMAKLGIDENEVKSIIGACECGEINGAYFIDLTKMRKWEIQETIGNDLDADLYGADFCLENKRMSTFCKAFGIEESEIAEYFALAICNQGYEIAYTLTSNKDVVLVLTDDARYENSFVSYAPSQQTEEEDDTMENEYAELFDVIKQAEKELHTNNDYDIRENTEDGKGYIVDLDIIDNLMVYHSLVKGEVISDKEESCRIIKEHTGIINDNVIKRISNDVDMDFVKMEFGILFHKEEESSSSSQSIEEYDAEEQIEAHEMDESQMEENMIVEFKIESIDDGRLYLKGTWDISTYDEDTDDGDWEYEQNDGFYQAHLPTYWKVDGENLSQEYNDFLDSIDWEMFRQYLYDFRNENRTFVRGENILHINEGAVAEVDIQKHDDFDDTYCASVFFRYNGELIIFSDNIIEDLADSIEFDGYRVTSASSIDMILSREFINEDSEEVTEIKAQMENFVQKYYAKQLVRNALIEENYNEIIAEDVEEQIYSYPSMMFAFQQTIEFGSVRNFLYDEDIICEEDGW